MELRQTNANMLILDGLRIKIFFKIKNSLVRI